MIKKFHEHTNVDIRKIMTVEDIEDQLLRLKEVLNCKIRTQTGSVIHGMFVDKYYIQWDNYTYPTTISFSVEPPYESIYNQERTFARVFKASFRLPNSKDINENNINIGISVSKEMQVVERRIKNMYPKLCVYITQANPTHKGLLDNNNLKSYYVRITIGQLKAKV